MGKRTFAGHMKAIWSSSETKDFREGVDETVKKIKNGDKKDKSVKKKSGAKKSTKRKIKKRSGNIKASKRVNRKRHGTGKKKTAR